MKQSYLPDNGVVIVIDDKIEEALPLIRILSSNGVSTTYYSGDALDFPSIPTQTVRIIFLDLQTVSTDEHTLATMHVNNLKKLLRKNNGPYLIVTWSKKGNIYSDAFKTEVNNANHGIRPAFILNLKKDRFFESKYDRSKFDEFRRGVLAELDARFTDTDLAAIGNALDHNVDNTPVYIPRRNILNAIERELKEELQKAGIFHLFVIWERIINKAAGLTINDFSSLCAYDQLWERNMRYILKRMAKAQVGDNLNRIDANETIRLSLKTLQNSYLDRIETELISGVVLRDIDIRKGDIIYEEIINNSKYSLILKQNKFHLSINGTINRNGRDKLDKLELLYNAPQIKIDIRTLVNHYKTIANIINRNVLLDVDTPRRIQPGNVYELRKIKTDKKKRNLKNYFSDNFLNKREANRLVCDTRKVKLIELDVTPPCDYSHKEKWVNSRLISGVVFPADYSEGLKEGQSFYGLLAEFEFNSVPHKIVFDCRLVKAKSKHGNAHPLNSILFRVKNEVLADIMAKISSYINRPGVMTVE